MAISRREIVKDLMAQGVSKVDAEAQATEILAQQGDVIFIDAKGKERPVKPGRSIFDSPE